MNEEFLLQAVGHIDEDLIAEAEEYRPGQAALPAPSPGWTGRLPGGGIPACTGG